MNKLEQPQKPAPDPEKNVGLSRRAFLEKTLMATAALGLGLPSKKLFGQNYSAETTRTIEQNKNEVNDLVNGYLEQDTVLSEQEIRTSLEKCGFVEKINIQELQIEKPWVPLIERDALGESLQKSLSMGNLSLEEKGLNIIQTDFKKIGALSYGAFYINEHKSLFVNQEKPENRRRAMENFIYKEAISNEYKRVENNIYNSRISDIEKDQKRASLNEWLEDSMKNPKKYTEIPKTVALHIESIKKSLKEFCTKEAINKILTQTNLPHETFHYFYETKIAKEGYDGPSIDKLLAMAIRGKYKRFGNNDPGYSNISYFLKDININNPQELDIFCKNIAEKHNITSRPKKYSSEEWKLLSDQEKDNHLIEKSFFEFLNEYLARIYNGALGNGPKSARIKLEEAASGRNDLLPQNIDELYHEPTEEELAMLKQMQWKGVPILK